MPKPTAWNLEDKCFSGGGQGEKYLIRFLLYLPNNFTPYNLHSQHCKTMSVNLSLECPSGTKWTPLGY